MRWNMGLFSNIKEILKTAKHQKPSQKYCPKCASMNITLSNETINWLMPRQYHCNICGYTGPIIMELEKEEETQDPA